MVFFLMGFLWFDPGLSFYNVVCRSSDKWIIYILIEMVKVVHVCIFWASCYLLLDLLLQAVKVASPPDVEQVIEGLTGSMQKKKKTSM